MHTLTITNNHTGHTFRERVTADRVSGRLAWYRDRGRKIPCADGSAGWVVVSVDDNDPGRITDRRP